MNSLFVCVSQRHDLRLVALAAVICGLAVCSGFALCGEACRTVDRRAAHLWTAACIVAITSAIWATHFVAMLAFDPGTAFELNAPRTALSFLVALVVMGVVVLALVHGERTRGLRLIAGVVAGLAISVMHYTGMSAFETEGYVVWDRGGVAASIGSGLLFSVLAAVAASSHSKPIRLLGPALFVLAIVLDHFFGMSAARIVFDPSVAAPPPGVSKATLLQLVAATAIVIAALSCAALWLATRDRRRNTAEDLRLRDLADIAVEGLLICQADVIVSVNRSLEKTLCCTEELLIGHRIDKFLPGITASAVPLEGEKAAMLYCATNGAIPVTVVGQHIMIRDRPHLVIAVRDQRERLRNELQISQLARLDALTGVANRLGFNETLTERLAKCSRDDGQLALLVLDLDRFKAINDMFGHGMGDELLRRVAGRLGKIVRATDTVARLGGDEFAIILDPGSLPRVRGIAEHVVDLLSRPFLIDGNIIEISGSVGIALAPSDASEPVALARDADLAAYRAKQEGGSTYRLFEAEMNAKMQARRSLEADLRRALLRHEFELHYQPLVDARTGAYQGAEALIRWRHPRRGLVSPAEFIPLAEEIGVIGSLGEWVLRTACAEAVTWPPHLSVAVNMSPLQFRDPRLAATVASILAETTLPGSRLELEVTESVLMHDGLNTASLLHDLRALGVRISLDDFGTGYSSLSYLRRFPFDKIKIDQSFARQTPHDRESVAIVQAITTLGSKLGMTVTVEGVETSEQRAFIIAEGCDQIQGYLISRPVQAQDVRVLFDAGHARTAA